MTKKKYSLVLGLSMLLFVLSLVLFCVAFVLKESIVALFYIILILAIGSFIASLVLLFANRKGIIEYESGKRKPSKKSLKKAEKKANKEMKKADKEIKKVDKSAEKNDE